MTAPIPENTNNGAIERIVAVLIDQAERHPEDHRYAEVLRRLPTVKADLQRVLDNVEVLQLPTGGGKTYAAIPALLAALENSSFGTRSGRAARRRANTGDVLDIVRRHDEQVSAQESGRSDSRQPPTASPHLDHHCDIHAEDQDRSRCMQLKQTGASAPRGFWTALQQKDRDALCRLGEVVRLTKPQRLSPTETHSWVHVVLDGWASATFTHEDDHGIWELYAPGDVMLNVSERPDARTWTTLIRPAGTTRSLRIDVNSFVDYLRANPRVAGVYAHTTTRQRRASDTLRSAMSSGPAEHRVARALAAVLTCVCNAAASGSTSRWPRQVVLPLSIGELSEWTESKPAAVEQALKNLSTSHDCSAAVTVTDDHIAVEALEPVCPVLRDNTVIFSERPRSQDHGRRRRSGPGSEAARTNSPPGS